jgi:hypothetical protein
MTKRILFLFNHDAAHQAAHIAGIAGELALHAPTVQVVVACGVEAIRHKVAEIIPAAAHDRIEWRMLDLPTAEQRLLAPINKVAPVLRVARLYRHLDLFRRVDLVVSTERTCLRVRRRLGAAGPRFAYVPHGSGDRNVAYHPELAQFEAGRRNGAPRHNDRRQMPCHRLSQVRHDRSGGAQALLRQ